MLQKAAARTDEADRLLPAGGSYSLKHIIWPPQVDQVKFQFQYTFSVTDNVDIQVSTYAGGAGQACCSPGEGPGRR